jgi:hypothetical protein
VLQAASLGIAAIGAGYAALRGSEAKYGGKQVDRLLSNEGFDVDALFEPWVTYVVGPRPQLVVALDWTDFEDDDHTTLCAYAVTDHGRATPLVWKTVLKSSLRTRRTGYEHALIERLHDLVPEAVDVTLLADRGFGDQALYALLEVLGWDYVIRFRSNILVEDEHGVQQTAAAWVGTGRAKKLPRARVTADRALVAAVVVVHAKGMKEPWCLATTLGGERASAIVKRYGKRFSIEETFRDEKDLHFGMGLSATHIGRADRRDRLLMLAALAHTLLTLLGEASEETGLDRTMRSNARKKRVLSLYHQGVYWFSAMGAMREEWFVRLMSAFDRLVAQHPFCREIFGVI